MSWWNRLRAALGLSRGEPELPGVGWLAADQTPFGVPLLDVAPLARAARSSPPDPARAEASREALERETGRRFADWSPPSDACTTPCSLSFAVDPGGPPQGALFRPRVLEEKWGLYVCGDRIVGVRAWTAEPVFALMIARQGSKCTVTAIHGELGDPPPLDRDPDHRARVVDFLLRSHGLGEILPAPLPPGSRSEPPASIARQLFQRFGRRALAGAEADLREPRPTRPLRVDTPVWMAAAYGDRVALEAALSEGIRPLHPGVFDGTTPLHAAAGLGATECVRVLLDHGVPVDIADEAGGTPLLRAARQHGAPVDASIALLLARGADPRARQEDGTTALHLAARAGRSKAVALLLEAGAAADPVDARGFSPLHSAAELGLVPLVELLLRAGADPSRAAPGPQGSVTPLELARSRGHADVCEQLCAAIDEGSSHLTGSPR